MKQLLTFLASCLLGSVLMAQPCAPNSTVPYMEDFETFTTGSPGTVGQNWTRTSNNTGSLGWFVDNGGTGSGGTGPATDHTTGTSAGIYMYTETSSPTALGDTFALTSPCIDLVGTTAPRLTFWYHMFGAGMGTLEVHILDGTTDSTVWSLSGQQQQSDSEPYRQAIIDLTAYVGMNVQVSFVSIHGGDFTGDMAIDDIALFQAPDVDVVANSLLSPQSDCGLTATEAVTVQVINQGALALNNAVASFSLDGSPFGAPEAIPGPIAPGDTVNYTFTATADLSVSGSHTLVVVATSPQDTLNMNDTISATIISIPLVSSFPYFEDFEAGFGGWTPDVLNSQNSTWAFGTPQKSTIQGASSGLNAWVNGGLSGSYNANESSAVNGPCFDFTSLTNPLIRMDIWWNSEFSWDGAVLQSSIDAGQTWQNVGAVGDPNNWYTDNTINGNPGGQQEGWTGRVSTSNGSGGWVRAEHLLDGLGGQSSVLLRIAFGSDGSVQDDGFAFDNINILELPPINGSMLTSSSPNSGCGLSAAETVTVSFTNVGTTAISNFPISYSVNGGTPVSEQFTGTLNAGDTATYSFTTGADLSTPAIYDIRSWFTVPGDTDGFNDTIDFSVEHFTPDVLPYFEDLQSFIPGAPLPTGWTVTTTSNSNNVGWQVDQGGTGSSGTGPNTDHTLGTGAGIYFYTETSGGVQGDTYTLTTNCIDLTGASLPKLSFWYHMHGADMGSLEAKVVQNDGTETSVFLAVGQQQAIQSDPYLEAIADLTSFAGETIQLRFVGTRGNGFTGDMAIDDISIKEPAPIDALADEVLAPLSGCALTANEAVSVSVVNFGSSPLANAVASFSVDGGAFTTPETIPTTIAPGDTLAYTFTATADLSAPGFHEVVIVTTSITPADTLNQNDTVSISLITYPQVSTFPYSEDFENGEGGWLEGGVNNSWTFGTPAKSVIQGASSGVNAWVTGGLATGDYNANEQSWVVSPCFDFSGLTSASISLDIWWEIFFSTDGAVLQSSVDGGQSWQNVGSFGDPNNWYNDNTIDAQPGGSVEGWSGTTGFGGGPGQWVTARHNLDGLAGESQVILRMAFGSGAFSQTDGMAFDNVNIFQGPPVDMRAEAILSPLGSTCFSGTEDVIVQLINKGSLPLDFSTDNTTVGVDIAGPNPQSLSSVISAGTLNPEDTLDYTITVPADLTTPGIYTLTAYVAAPGDTLPGNDTTASVTLQSIPLQLGTLTEDFENFDPATNNGWVITNPSPFVGWRPDQGGTGSSGTGPAVDLTLGTAAGTYFYTETSGGGQGDTYSFLSPCVDLSVNPDPKLAFGWHMFGANMGTLEVHIITPTLDTIVFTRSGPFQGADTDPWETDTVDLNFVGTETIQIEFVGIRGSGFTGDMAIDDVKIILFSPEDVEPTALIQPVSDCGLADTSIVEISYSNVGPDTIIGVDLSYNINGGTYITETVGDTLAPGTTITHTFATRADLSAPGTYNIGVVTNAANDINKFNDTTSYLIDSRPVVSSFPYVEDFESGNGGWSSDGTNNSWAFGTPAKNTIIGAASGANAWVTGGLGTGSYNPNENSFLLGPCFDFSTLDSPTVFLDVWWNSEFSWDGAALQTSIDDGASWQTIGNVGDPDNWYTDNTINGNPGGQQQGWSGRNSSGNGSGGWVTAQNRLFGLGGQPKVLMRIAFGSDGSVQDDGVAFDNIRITGLIDQDAGATTLLYPLGECGLTANDSIVVGLSNLGRDTLNGPFTFNYILNGGTQQSITVTDQILPNRGIPVVISNVDLSPPGPYTLKAWPSGIAGDANNFNDTLTVTIESSPGGPLPISDNFNNYPDGEEIFADLVNDQFADLPWEVNFNGTGSSNTGPNDDVTGGGGYIYMEASGSADSDQARLSTGCLDLTTATNPKLFYSYHMYGSSIGFLSIDGETAAGQTNLGLLIGEQQFDSNDPWITDTIDLAPFIGQTINITFTGQITADPTGTTFRGDISLDNIEIRELLANDVGVTNILAPTGEDCGDDSTIVEVEIVNFGTNAQSNFPVSANISGGTVATVNGTFNGTLDAGDTATLVIGGFNSNTGGVMTISAFTGLPSDQFVGNNTAVGVAVFAVSPEAPLAVNDSVCFTDTAIFDLAVTGIADEFYWYDSITGGNLIATGTSFQTPMVTSSVDYYVEARSFRPQQLETSLNELFNAQDGSMFDLTAIGSPIEVDSFDINIDGAPGPTINVEVYYLDSSYTTSYDGVSITNPNDWTLLGTSTVTSAGEGNSTRVPVGGLTIPEGATYGIYITATGISGLTHDFGTSNYSGPNLNLSAGISVAYPFGGPSNNQVLTNRSFSGRVYYQNLGCNSDRTPVSGTILPVPPVDLGPDGIECEGFLLDASNPTFVSYDWGNNITTPTLRADTTGSYIVNVVDFFGCTAADTVVLIINDAPDVDLGPDATACNMVTLDAGNPGASYIWSVAGQFAQTLDVDQSGTYSVTVNQLGCEASDTVNVTILPGPVVDLGADREACDPITLDAGNAGATYQWSTGEVSQTIMVMPPPTGTSDTISVTVTTANGCDDMGQIIITGGTEPVVDLGMDQVACDSVVLDAGNAGATFLWSTGGTGQMETITQSGSITVIVAEANGCSSTDTVDVTVNTIPTADFTFNAPNYLFTYDFTNTSTGGVDSVLWDFGDGVGTSTDLDPSYTYGLAGAFEVTLIVYNDCGTDTTRQILAGVAIDEEFNAMISVYPNPTTEDFYVELNGFDFQADKLTIEVTDTRGRKVFQHVEENIFGLYRQRVDLTRHAEGVYLVRISDGERTAYKRIMKE